MLKVVVGVFYITQQPLWQYHEADFLRVVRILRDEGKLPVLAEDAAPDTRNNSQPPLYYYSLLPFVTAIDDNQVTPAGVNPPAVCDGFNTNLTSLVTTSAYDDPLHGTIALGYVLRFVSLITSLIAVVFTYLAGRILFPDKPYLALLAAAFVAFEPTSMIVASEINNDNLILALGAVHLWFCARLIHRKGALIGNLAGLLIVAVLALLSKISGWLMLGISIVLIANFLLQMTRQRISRRQKQVALGIAGAFIVAVVGIIAFNMAQYGSPLGRYRGLEKTVVTTLQNLSPRHVVNMTVATLQDTFADYLNPLRSLQPRGMVLVAYGGLLVIGILASAVGIVQVIRKRNKAGFISLALLLGYALAMVALVIFRSILNNGTPNFVNIMIIISPVRYYAPALPALALICAAGFASIGFRPAKSIGLFVGTVIAACWLLVSALGLSVPISMNQLRSNSVMSLAQYDVLTGITQVQATQDNTLPQILGYRLQPNASAGLVNLDLYVQARQAFRDSYVLETHLSSGSSTSSCRVVPVRGLYPTTRWQPDQVVVIHSQVPNCVAPQTPPIDVELQWLKSTTHDGLASTQAEGSLLKLATVNDALALAAACPMNKGMIGGGLQLLKYNSPASTTVTTELVYFTASVNWLVRSIPPDAVIRSYKLTHTESGSTLQCDGVPRQGTYPFNKWSAGETVYFDECVMKITPDVPKGIYTVSVGIKNADKELLVAVDSTGTDVPSGYIDIGTLEIK